MAQFQAVAQLQQVAAAQQAAVAAQQQQQQQQQRNSSGAGFQQKLDVVNGYSTHADASNRLQVMILEMKVQQITENAIRNEGTEILKPEKKTNGVVAKNKGILLSVANCIQWWPQPGVVGGRPPPQTFSERGCWGW